MVWGQATHSWPWRPPRSRSLPFLHPHPLLLAFDFSLQPKGSEVGLHALDSEGLPEVSLSPPPPIPPPLFSSRLTSPSSPKALWSGCRHSTLRASQKSLSLSLISTYTPTPFPHVWLLPPAQRLWGRAAGIWLWGPPRSLSLSHFHLYPNPFSSRLTSPSSPKALRSGCRHLTLRASQKSLSLSPPHLYHPPPLLLTFDFSLQPKGFEVGLQALDSEGLPEVVLSHVGLTQLVHRGVLYHLPHADRLLLGCGPKATTKRGHF